MGQNRIQHTLGQEHDIHRALAWWGLFLFRLQWIHRRNTKWNQGDSGEIRMEAVAGGAQQRTSDQIIITVTVPKVFLRWAVSVTGIGQCAQEARFRTIARILYKHRTLPWPNLHWLLLKKWSLHVRSEKNKGTIKDNGETPSLVKPSIWMFLRPKHRSKIPCQISSNLHTRLLFFNSKK